MTLDPASNLTGFDASRISFDGTNVYADFQSLAYTSSSNVTLNLSFTPAATTVPEPSSVLTFAVAALGLGGLAVAARRRKTNANAGAAA